MKATAILASIQNALRNLNPGDVRDSARLPFTVELHAASPLMYERMKNFFLPASSLSGARFGEASQLVRRSGTGISQGTLLRVYEQGVPHTSGRGFTFDTLNPDKVLCDIIEAHPDLKLSLARQLEPFRAVVSSDIVRQISKENALFSVATAMPSIIPLVSLPWAVGEFASDTAFLTANQIRMAFMLAAANDRTVGYREQKAEIASLFAGAFGWRAIARELVGKIPMGGGIIPKAAVSFAATYVVGSSLERLYRVGYGFTTAERQEAYQQAVEKGKALATSLLNSYRSQRNA